MRTTDQSNRRTGLLVFAVALLVTLGCVAGIPRLGIYGIPLATGLTYLSILLLIRRTVQAKNKRSLHGP